MENWKSVTHVKSCLARKEGQFAMFVGRWQPLHEAHKHLFAQAMNEGKNVLICVRDVTPDDKNPYTADEVVANVESVYERAIKNGVVRVMKIPDITSVEFGRGVGYDIIERIPPQEIAEISATNVREALRKEGKL